MPSFRRLALDVDGRVQYPRDFSNALLAATALLLPLAACGEGSDDPLSVEAITRVMQARGDATGTESSGVYTGSLEAVACDCPTDSMESVVTFCSALERLSDSFGFDASLEVIQADGSLRIAPDIPTATNTDTLLIPTMYGSLTEDGTATLGGLLQADALLVRSLVVGRFDGTLDADGLDGEIRQSYSVHSEVTVSEDEQPVDSIAVSFECEETIAVELVWTGPPRAPLDPSSGDG